jgi:hypothetical protein
MTDRRGLLILGLPLLALSGLFTAALMRQNPEPRLAVRSPRTPDVGEVAATGPLKREARSPGQPPAPTRMPAPKDIGSAASNARVQTTYTNFRIAVANDNQAVQRALLPLLQKDRETALWYARDDVAVASSEQDRAIARRTLQALEK